MTLPLPKKQWTHRYNGSAGMSWTIDKHGNEVDELGYLRPAVEAWAKHGIYPPPLAGSPSNPAVLASVRANRAKVAELPPEEQKRWHEAQRQFGKEFAAAFASPPTRASSSS